jgi:hypothetical protein
MQKITTIITAAKIINGTIAQLAMDLALRR